MDFLSIVIFIILLIAIFYFIRLTLNLDCDYTLTFLERFGKSPATLSGKVVWITGSSAGIGKAIAYELAKAGCKLVLSGTKIDRLNEVKKECLNINNLLDEQDILIVPFNMTDYDEHANAFNKIIRHFNKLDILVNNAGVAQSGEFESIELSLDKFVFDVNVFGTINLSKIAIRHWLQNDQKGHIVINSSTSAILNNPWASSYVASKAALNAYIESMRKEYRNKQIKLSIVCPGPVDTDIFQNSFTRKIGTIVDRDFVNDSKTAGVFIFTSAQRCAELFVIAIANETSESWLCKQPILVFTFLHKYMHFSASFIWNQFLDKHEKAMKNLYL